MYFSKCIPPLQFSSKKAVKGTSKAIRGEVKFDHNDVFLKMSQKYFSKCLKSISQKVFLKLYFSKCISPLQFSSKKTVKGRSKAIRGEVKTSIKFDHNYVSFI